MKGFIEVDYKGSGRVGVGHDICSGKVLINIKQIKMIEGNRIFLADGEETIYYTFTCTYEEIKQKIKEAQEQK